MNLAKAYDRYGASMGRRDHHAADRTAPIKLRLARVRLDSGGYDSGGAYWGVGSPLFCAWSDEEEVQFFLRADSREAAKIKVRTIYPNARFYR